MRNGGGGEGEKEGGEGKGWRSEVEGSINAKLEVVLPCGMSVRA
jgi:hypothetical protein